MANATTARPLTDTMKRELYWINRYGEPSDLAGIGPGNALSFYAREKVLSALLSRELIRDEPGGFVLTDSGRSALAGSR